MELHHSSCNRLLRKGETPLTCTLNFEFTIRHKHLLFSVLVPVFHTTFTMINSFLDELVLNMFSI